MLRAPGHANASFFGLGDEMACRFALETVALLRAFALALGPYYWMQDSPAISPLGTLQRGAWTPDCGEGTGDTGWFQLVLAVSKGFGPMFCAAVWRGEAFWICV